MAVTHWKTDKKTGKLVKDTSPHKPSEDKYKIVKRKGRYAIIGLSGQYQDYLKDRLGKIIDYETYEEAIERAKYDAKTWGSVAVIVNRPIMKKVTGKGWRKESARHAMSSRGLKSGRKQKILSKLKSRFTKRGRYITKLEKQAEEAIWAERTAQEIEDEVAKAKRQRRGKSK